MFLFLVSGVLGFIGLVKEQANIEFEGGQKNTCRLLPLTIKYTGYLTEIPGYSNVSQSYNDEADERTLFHSR